MNLFTLILSLSLVACGTDDSSEQAPAATTAEREKPAAATLDEVKGPKGDKGDRGDKGDKGDTGDAGKDGTAGADGQTVNANMWYDPIDDRFWLFGSLQAWNTSTCAGDWRLPTLAELNAARMRGLFIAANDVGAPQHAWTSDTYNGYHTYVKADGSLIAGVAWHGADSDLHGIFCVENMQ